MYLFDKFITVLKQHGQYSENLASRLEDMQRSATPSQDEIADLLIRIGMGRSAGKQLFARQYAGETEKQQLTEIVSAGEAAVRQLSECGWIFILPVLMEYIGPTRRFDELWELGSTALHRALITYHYVPSCRFLDYANVWIHQLIDESFQENSVYVPSLRQLADYQAAVEQRLYSDLNRSASIEEVTFAMRYLPVRKKEEIALARRLKSPLNFHNETLLRLAMTKTLLVREYLELSQEFTMLLNVTVEGKSFCFNNVVRIEQSLMQEVKELYRCGVSRCTNQDDLTPSSTPWRCRTCRQEHRLEGCKRWEEVISIHKQPERICLWLDDGRKFYIEDDFWSIARQLSSSLDH